MYRNISKQPCKVESFSYIFGYEPAENRVIDQELFLGKAFQTDSLTQLFNKGAIEAHICALLQKTPDANYACWILDVGDFKSVNDTLGHMVGDQLLQEIADRLQQVFRKSDVLGRIDGDDFLVFAEYNGNLELLAQRGKTTFYYIIGISSVWKRIQED